MFILDRMEVQGFKSFYGRTQFEFRPGIIAVVGPNGCGKSNIGDAISWVLGDQSPRSLRADRMEDVIFNGSEARKPMGMAEVTLRFLGANGGPDPAEEFLVTRRLYRSGESEYALNGSRCRLRDIQEMLARSQVGSRLYSVIEQGKVDLILSSKPKDRRSLFEEAAGILGYKSKRRITLGKLEATQANLVRLHDILTEVEKQANSLRRQVAKARRYERLQERIRSRRGILLGARLLDLDKERESVSTTRRMLADREVELSAGLARCEARRESLRRQYEEDDGEAQRSRHRLSELDREIDRNRLLLERSRERLSEARQASERWTLESAEIQRHLTERLAKLTERATLLERGRNELAVLESSLGEKEDEQRLRMRESQRSEEASEARRSELLMSLDRLAEARSRLQRIEEDLSRLAERRRELEKEIAGAAEETERRGVEREELSVLVASRSSERDRVRREKEDTEGALIREDGTLRQLAEMRETLAGTVAQSEERLRALDEAERTLLSNGHAGVGAVLSGAREGRLQVRGRVADVLEVDPEWTTAADAALGEFLGAVLVSEPREALAGVHYLKETGRGRCSFVPLSERPVAPRSVPPGLLSDPRFGGVLSERIRLGDESTGALKGASEGILLAPNLEAALEMHRVHPEWTYVTADGDLVHSSGLIQGGARGPGEKGLLSHRREREEQKRRLGDAVAERDRLEVEREKREGSRRELVERLSTLDERMRDREREWVEARFRLTQREEDLSRLVRTIEVAGEEQGRADREERKLLDERDRLSEVLAVAATRRRELEEEISAALGNLAARREEASAGSDALGVFRAQVAVERQKIASREEEVAGLRQSVPEEQERLVRAEAEARTAVDQAQQLETNIAALSAALLGRQGERGEMAVRLERREADVATLKTELLEAEQREKDARTHLDELKMRIADSEVAAARMSVELRHLETSCREELAIGLEELRALPPAAGEVSREDLEQEMADLKGRLERLGAVNLVALEQYREMEERRSFLGKQKQDLEESIASLNDTIRKINRTSREKFARAFEKIQEEFNRSFVALFGGGRAELRLMEDEDVLECGVEITASPPGKRLQSISLLSGGEKAMTAVALLFALFRYRPSPFCVLDEVDAPLDDANVARFTRMLRELTPETQFILITHNRRSMEAADLLYGITMEEPGISKAVSMRLEN